MWVDWDPDYVAIGLIEPVFVEEIVDYYDRYLSAPDEPIIAMWSEPNRPIMIKTLAEWTPKPLPTPIPRTDVILRWRRVN